jgi:hypothetical protein
LVEFSISYIILAKKGRTSISKLVNKDKKVLIKLDARYRTNFPFTYMDKTQEEIFQKLRKQEKQGIKMNWNDHYFYKEISLAPYLTLIDIAKNTQKNNYYIPKLYKTINIEGFAAF